MAHISSQDVAGVLGDVSSQAEVTDLGHPTLGQQDIPGGQISMYTLSTKKEKTSVNERK